MWAPRDIDKLLILTFEIFENVFAQGCNDLLSIKAMAMRVHNMMVLLGI